MSDKVYSSNGETFSDFETVMDDLEGWHDLGEEVTIYEGEKIPFHHASFFSVDTIVEQMQDNAYDRVPEFSESYLEDFTVENKRALQDLIIRFFNDHAKQPNFYAVVNVKEVKIKVGGDEI